MSLTIECNYKYNSNMGYKIAVEVLYKTRIFQYATSEYWVNFWKCRIQNYL